MTSLFTKIMLSPWLYTVLLVAGIILVPLRLWGILFFLGEGLNWVLVPPLTFIALLIISMGAVPPHLWTCAIILIMYALSLAFHGIDDTAYRIREGGFWILNVAEMTCTAVLFLRVAILLAYRKELADYLKQPEEKSE